MTDPNAPRWGRGRRGRIQHAWSRIPAWAIDGQPAKSGYLFPVCGNVDAKAPVRVNFDSDAARCERCTAILTRREREAAR